MLKNETTGIAVRLYDNNKYGTSYGKGLYRKAIYNGTIEIKSQDSKYLVDLYNYNDWANTAKSDVDMEFLNAVDENTDQLYSWVKHYDKVTQTKTLVPGMCVINTTTLKMVVLICDEVHDLKETWNLSAKPCKLGPKAPQILATNMDLGGL